MLRLLGLIYGKITDLRNSFYDRGIFKSYDLGARTISIGNITTGGTGKTPLVAHVAEILADAGEKVCILTRGYGRETSGRVLVSDGENVLVDAMQGGDEPVELARKLVGKATIVADANRVAAASWIREKFGSTAFVLDDAFQHRRAQRDLDIVCIDATDPCGGGRLLPAGRLRETFKNIGRADIIVITRSDLVTSIDAIKERVRRWNPHAPIFSSRTEIVGLTPLSQFQANGKYESLNPDSLRSADSGQLRALAFCGLGNFNAFFTQLMQTFSGESGGFDLTAVQKFPDHHRYTQSDIQLLNATARAADASAMLTTAKDATKLNGFEFELPCYVVSVEVRFDDPESFRKLITSS